MRPKPRVLLVVFSLSAASIAGCGGAVRPPTEAAAPEPGGGQRIILPQGLVGVGFSGVDTAPTKALSLGKAVALKTRVDAAFKKNHVEEGHEQWFFHAFDAQALYFFVGRFHLKCTGMLGCMEYVIETIYRVARSDKAEADLGVADTVGLWEEGILGIKGGMSAAEVKAVLGEPPAEEVLQYVGSFRYSYSTVSVTFLGGRVAFVHPAED
jgi:hypothetical protein